MRLLEETEYTDTDHASSRRASFQLERDHRQGLRLGNAGAGYSSGVSAMFTIYLVLIVAGIVLYATVGLAHL